jgi:hypothetical protein
MAMARYVVRINVDGCEEDRNGSVSQVEDRLVGSNENRKLMHPLLILQNGQ